MGKKTEYSVGTTAIIQGADGNYTFRDYRGNEGPMSVESVKTDPQTNRRITTFGSGWQLSVDPKNPDVGATITSVNGRTNNAVVTREKGGYIRPDPVFSTAPDLGGSFGAATIPTAERLGLGQKDFENLMKKQREWERTIENGGTANKQSPVFAVQLRLQRDQETLGMDDSAFGDLLQRQSQHMSQSERGLRDGEAAPRTSPLEAALNAMKIESRGSDNYYPAPQGLGR